MRRTKTTLISAVLLAVLAAGGLAGAGRRAPGAEDGFVRIPGGDVRAGSPEGGGLALPQSAVVNDCRLGRCEVTVAEYARFLNESGYAHPPPLVQMKRAGTLYRPRLGHARRPVSHVSHADAEAYCRWLSSRIGAEARLPTEQEWEHAARGGIPGARFPWGWGDPAGLACWESRGPRRVGSYPPNPFGLYDMAGNVFEWCRGEGQDGDAPARGGSWSERGSDSLRVFHRRFFPRTYRDADVGFRVLVEQPQQPGETCAIRPNI